MLVSLKMVALWFFGSMIISALISRIKPPTLKLSPPKTDTPIQLFDKRNK